MHAQNLERVRVRVRQADGSDSDQNWTHTSRCSSMLRPRRLLLALRVVARFVGNINPRLASCGEDDELRRELAFLVPCLVELRSESLSQSAGRQRF